MKEEMDNLIRDYAEIEAKRRSEKEEILRMNKELEMRCAALRQELEFEMEGKIIAKKECKKFEAMHHSMLEEFERERSCLEEKWAFEGLEKLAAEHKYKKLEKKHDMVVLEKLNVENAHKECKAQLEELKNQLSIMNERECTRRLLEDSKESTDLEKHKEIASQSDEVMTAKSLSPDNRSNMYPGERSAAVFNLKNVAFESVPLPASDSTPRNEALGSSGALLKRKRES